MVSDISVGHLYTNDGGVDKYRTLVWKQEFIRQGISVYNVDREEGYINVGWVSHPIARGRFMRCLALKRMGLPVVMGVDDDYHNLPEKNRAYDLTRGSWDYLREAAEISEVVVVTTEELAEQFAPYNEHVIIIPNYIPDDELAPWGAVSLKERTGNFGWAGSLETHPGDLETIAYAVRDLVLEDGLPFHHIGQGKVSSIVNAPVYEHGKVDKETYIDSIFNTFDVGLAPLAKLKFNDSKSNLKLLEYSALGVPWVASPRREYLRTHKQYGVGIIASKPRQWRQAVRRLLTDSNFYLEQRKRNWDWASGLVMSKHYTEWVEAFELALRLDKKLPRHYNVFME